MNFLISGLWYEIYKVGHVKVTCKELTVIGCVLDSRIKGGILVNVKDITYNILLRSSSCKLQLTAELR